MTNTVTDLLTQRATAGARYAAAMTELHAAFVGLFALDKALQNGFVFGGNVATFFDPPDSQPWGLSHPVYAPRSPSPNWRDEASASAVTLLASFSPVPGAPTIGAAVAGVASASVAFTPPAGSDQPAPGLQVTYTATSSPGGITASSLKSPINVPGLTTGTAYTFTVRAANASGAGTASSASNSVTPT